MLIQMAEFLSQPLMLEAAYIERLGRLTLADIGAKIEKPDVVMIAREQAATASKSSGKVVAVIPVFGIIDARESWVLQMLGGTSLESLMQGVDICLNEPRIGGIIFDFDTPGGSASGVKVSADQIFALRGQIPMVSMVRYCMASAGYYLGAATSRIIADPTSMIGSIGVGMDHMDKSKALEQAGMKTTIWRVPEFKMEGHPAEPLSDAAKAHIQARIEGLYEDFTNDVAKYRGTNQKDVKETYGMGRTLDAKSALACGMIDKIGTFKDVCEQMKSGTMARSLAQSNRMEGEVDAAVLKNRMSMMELN